MSIVAVMNNFVVGGAERVMMIILNDLVRCGHTVTLVVDHPTTFMSDHLDSRVDVRVLGEVRGLLSRTRTLRNTLRSVQCDTLVCTQRSTLVAVAGALVGRKGRSVKVVAREAASNVARFLSAVRPWYRRWVWKRVYRWAYGRADVLIANSVGTEEALRNSGFATAEKPLITIDNPVDIEALRASSEDPCLVELLPRDGELICWMGRLTEQKRPLDMVDALAKVLSKDPSIRLVMFGEGPQRHAVEERAERLGVSQNLVLAGKVENPFYVLARSDLFVLTSEYEGFGMVLLEALALDVPVIATDLRCGPRFILDHGRYGALYPAGDINELTRLILKHFDGGLGLEPGRTRAQDFAREKVCARYRSAILYDHVATSNDQ